MKSGWEAKMRLIDADALKEDFKARLEKAKNWKENALNNSDDELVIRATATIDFICEVIMTINNAPTVELFCSYLSDGEVRQPCVEAPCKHERMQGEWIKIFENPFTNGYICPFCGHKIQVTEQFLPKVTECESCGAKMKGGAE